MKIIKNAKAVFCLFSIISLTLTGCGGTKQAELSGDEAKAALDNAQRLSFTGSLKDINAFSKISADDKIAGYVEETGFASTKYTVYVDDKELFHILHDAKDYKEADPDVISYDTWEIYDQNDKCIGFTQERVIDDEYHLVFMDSDGNLKDYNADENAQIIYNKDNGQIGTVTARRSNWYGSNFDIQIDTPKSDTDIDLCDKIVMYMKNVTWINDEYRDWDD